MTRFFLISYFNKIQYDPELAEGSYFNKIQYDPELAEGSFCKNFNGKTCLNFARFGKSADA